MPLYWSEKGLQKPQPSKDTGAPGGDNMASFGSVAIRLGFVTQSQLDEAVKVQSAAAKAGLRKRIGEILIKKGYLTQEQFQQVLKGQTVGRKRIGAYELVSKLGEGGMGSVFKARQVYMDRPIALKILAPKMAKNKDFRDRFVREARAVAKLNHPHIVAGIDVGSADGYCYFAMEFVDGESLGEYMSRKGIINPDTALEFIRQIALALHHAHQNGLLHRDVKPDNILLDTAHKIAKLADLGLARSSDSLADDAQLTQAGQAVGTPFYMSPEQARGEADVTPATDMYSLGATLYHLLTGQVPYDGATAAVIMTRHLTDPVPSPRAVNPDVPSTVDKICQKLMQKTPEDRYTNAMGLVKDIERWQGEEKGDTPPPPTKERSRGRTQSYSSNMDRNERNERAERGSERSDRVSERLERQEREASPSASSPSVSATRAFRKRKQSGEIVGTALLCSVIVIGLTYLYSTRKPSPPSKNIGPPLKNATLKKTPQPDEPKLPEIPAFVPPLIEPALLTVEGNRRVYKANFEDGTHNFRIDPVFAKPNESIQVIGDKDNTNKVVKLAKIQHNQWACMAELLLPPDVKFSPKAELTFYVNFNATTCTDQTPEVRVFWDTVGENQTRALLSWNFPNTNYKTAWVKVRLLAGQPASRQPSRTPSDKPQVITIFAGKPGKADDVYIDDLELSDPIESFSSDPKNGKEPPVAQPEKETPAANPGN